MPDTCAHAGFGFLAARVVGAVVPWSVTQSTHVLPTLTFFACRGLCQPPTAIEALAMDALIVIAANLPDLVDKPLFLLRLVPGTRSYGHTLVFLVLITVATAVATAAATAAWPLSDLEKCDWAGVARVVFVAVASHLLADFCFGYVPLLWPLEGWEFRFQSIEKESHRKTARGWKRWLDGAAVLYISFGSGVPQRLGGWKIYAALLIGFMTVTEIVIRIIKTAARKRENTAKQCTSCS